MIREGGETLRRRSRSGSALLLAIFFLVVLFLLAQAFQALLPTELNSALRYKTDTMAYFVADSAIVDSMAWVEHELSSGREITTTPAQVLQRSGSIGDWTWTATVEPDAQTPPRGLSPLRIYKVTATALQGGRTYRRITSWVGQQSFAKFVMYADKVAAGIFKPTDSFHYDGPFHTNDPLTMFVRPGFYGSNLPPTFTSTVSTATAVAGSPDGIGYAGGGGPPYDGAGNPLPGMYEKIYQGGRNSVRSPVRPIDMPPNTSALLNAAWGDATSSPPQGQGVYVNTSPGNRVAGGVYIGGQVDSMLLSTDAAGNRSMRIIQGGKTVTVTETLASGVNAPNGTYVAQNSTLIVGPGNSTHVLSGTTNGVVFSAGSIESLSGVNRGARTIATDITSNTEIVVTGNITRSDTALGQVPTSSSDNLGLVTYKFRIPATVPRSVNAPLYVYGAILAGVPGGAGGFAVDQYNNYGLGVGMIQLVGSLSVSMKGIQGQFDFSTGAQLSGFKMDFHYDRNLVLTPPPFFPSFNKLTVRSWKEEALAH